MSDIEDYVEHITKKHEALTTTPPIYVYIDRINNRLVFKMKGGYMLELQTPETIKLFRSTKKLIYKAKIGENVPSLEVAEVDAVHCNLVDNQYHQKIEVLCTFTLSKSYAYLLIVEARNLVFLKTHNNEPHEIIITFTDQNGRPLEIQDKVNLTLPFE